LHNAKSLDQNRGSKQYYSKDLFANIKCYIAILNQSC